jgi:hypothetical protein
MRIDGVRHNERCRECKQSIEQMLLKLYGSVVRNARLSFPAKSEALEPSPIRETLCMIYSALQKERGFHSFVRRKNLPRCDFLVSDPGFVVEFDESQHFTPLRKLALSYYPRNLAFGFDVQRWKRLCDDYNSRDNDPPFRDEQRAWYDTLRDFAPMMKNMRPTIRIHARDCAWCSLNLDTFRQHLGQ